MKKIDVRLFIPLALLIGLGLGYLLFNQSKDSDIEAKEVAVAGIKKQIWTCSMHPQIRHDEPGLCPICEMDLIPQSANTGSGDPLVLQMTEDAVKLAEVETSIIGKGPSQNDLRLSGRIQADERRAASQVAHIPGRIEKLHVSFTGEQVERGQAIATIYSPELINAQRELIEAAKLVDVNPSLVVAARNKLRNWKIDEDQIQLIENRARIQETFVIKAESSGVVTSRRVAVGDHVDEGQVLFDLVNLEQLWVLFDVYEEDLWKIKLNDQITFTSNGVPGKRFRTKITFIDPIINSETRVAAVRGEILNNKKALKPEMFVQGILSRQYRNAEELLIPQTAVLWTGKRSVVYIKEPNTDLPSYRFQEVTLGDKVGDSYKVEKGLSSGDEVVTHGNFVIDAAAQLNNQQSMINKLVSIKGQDGMAIPDYLSQTPDRFHQQLSGLLGTYLSLKDALIASNAEQAQKEMEAFEDRLGGMSTDFFKKEDQIEIAEYWASQLEDLKIHASLFLNAKDIEAQRKQFEFLSNILIRVSKVFGTGSSTFYLQHCPMAFNNQGADWISAADTVLNPYFGDMMLRCGTVKGELP